MNDLEKYMATTNRIEDFLKNTTNTFADWPNPVKTASANTLVECSHCYKSFPLGMSIISPEMKLQCPMCDGPIKIEYS